MDQFKNVRKVGKISSRISQSLMRHLQIVWYKYIVKYNKNLKQFHWQHYKPEKSNTFPCLRGWKENSWCVSFTGKITYYQMFKWETLNKSIKWPHASRITINKSNFIYIALFKLQIHLLCDLTNLILYRLLTKHRILKLNSWLIHTKTIDNWKDNNERRVVKMIINWVYLLNVLLQAVQYK